MGWGNLFEGWAAQGRGWAAWLLAGLHTTQVWAGLGWAGLGCTGQGLGCTEWGRGLAAQAGGGLAARAEGGLAAWAGGGLHRQQQMLLVVGYVAAGWTTEEQGLSCCTGAGLGWGSTALDRVVAAEAWERKKYCTEAGGWWLLG
ncbi:hypothetical protein Acr_08g0008410 [Actinidia rufa]|uniref:Uncharacterized protein n=1 Tax=Actinidia rufa TaxID=165716 RepID=A0A7J0F174_9ERIC|nr:hypothetical protein Acr_08g0008410 [Actinidia rufa]